MILCTELTSRNQSGSISAKDLFYKWNAEQAMYFQDLVGRWQARGNGKSGGNTGLMLNEISISELSPFTISELLTISGGISEKPEDFEYTISLRVDNKKVFLIRPDQLTYAEQSVIDPPSVLNGKYYGTEYEDHYYILPTTASAPTLDYIASPTDVVWGFNFDAEGRQVYNPGTSVQPKWSNVTIIEITKRALTNFGVAWKDSDFTNAGRAAQATGD